MPRAGLGEPIEELRRNTAPYERLGITEITDHYDAIIRGLDEPPIIIGHSFGGLITMLLLDRGLGASAVAISPAQPKGVLTLPPAQARVASVALRNPANRHKAQMLTEKQFHYGFTNTLSAAESKPIYDRYAVPGPGRVLFQAALANFNPNAASKINFNNDDRAPLLIMANGKDHTVPAASARATFKLQSKSKATTVLREYADRPHLTAGVVGLGRDRRLRPRLDHAPPGGRPPSGRRDRLTGYGSHLTRIRGHGARATSTPAGIPRGQSVTSDAAVRPKGPGDPRRHRATRTSPAAGTRRVAETARAGEFWSVPRRHLPQPCRIGTNGAVSGGNARGATPEQDHGAEPNAARTARSTARSRSPALRCADGRRHPRRSPTARPGAPGSRSTMTTAWASGS